MTNKTKTISIMEVLNVKMIPLKTRPLTPRVIIEWTYSVRAKTFGAIDVYYNPLRRVLRFDSLEWLGACPVIRVVHGTITRRGGTVELSPVNVKGDTYVLEAYLNDIAIVMMYSRLSRHGETYKDAHGHAKLYMLDTDLEPTLYMDLFEITALNAGDLTVHMPHDLNFF